jgi:hypothetical protein
MDDEYNWDDWDSQATEYLGSDDYTGGMGEADTGSNWGPPQENQQDNFYQPPQYQGSSDYSSSFGPTQDWSSSVMNPERSQDWLTNPVSPQAPSPTYDFNTGQPGSVWGENTPSNAYTGSFNDFGLTNISQQQQGNQGSGDWANLLAKLFGGSSSQGSQGAQGPTGNRGIGSVLNDLVSGNGNNIDNIGNLVSRVLPFFAANQEKKSADEYRQLAENQLKDSQARMDPFAGERRQYMDLLRNSSDRLEGIYNNPMSSAMYTQAQNEMNRRIPRQMSKNRFGMGVNRAMAQQSPELMKAALDDARKTFDMYREPSGSNIRPNDNAAILQAVLGAQKQSLTNPMWSAGGQFLQGNQNQQGGNDAMTQILSFLAKNKG